MIPRQPSHQSSCVSSEGLRPILDLIQCIVCLDYFTAEGSERAPRLLDCSHSFCLSCCRDLITSKLVKRSRKKSISCPVCRTVTNLSKQGIESLPPNLTVIGLLDVPLLNDMRRPQPGKNLKRPLETSEPCPVTSEAKIQRIENYSSSNMSSALLYKNLEETNRADVCYGRSEARPQYNGYNSSHTAPSAVQHRSFEETNRADDCYKRSEARASYNGSNSSSLAISSVQAMERYYQDEFQRRHAELHSQRMAALEKELRANEAHYRDLASHLGILFSYRDNYYQRR